MGMFVVAPTTTNHHLLDQTHRAIHPTISNSNTGTAATALGVGVGVGVIPLLAGSIANNSNNNNNSIQFWQAPQTYAKKSILSDHGFGGGVGGVSGGGSASTSGSTMTCQDCGNQAKKDCNHRRCRTCCKSRGFDCATHVKSTWVPAARRRERQLIIGGATVAAGSSASTSGTKKPRLASRATTPSHTSTSKSFGTSSSHHQDASFMQSLPGQVRAPAVFKCVRVTAVEDGNDEYAYQASVTISGHVFKGFLYDQGVETRDQPNVVTNLSELHLGGGGGGRNVGCSLSSPTLNPPPAYGSSGGGLLG